MPCSNREPAAPTHICAANDNAAPDEGCVTNAGTLLSPGLARVVRALTRLAEEDEHRAANDNTEKPWS